MNHKLIVSKGWEGFADRLQCLSYCIDMAVKYNRGLCVDWSDTLWTEGFYRYFSIAGLEESKPNITHSIYPEFWTNAVNKSNGDWIYRIKDYVGFDIAAADGDTQVWVHAGVGFRAWSMTTLAKRLKIECLAELGEIKVYPSLVHLRGTDRPADLDKLQALAEQHPQAVVVSDDVTCVQKWLEINPQAQVLTETLSTDGRGLHQVGLHGWTRHQLNLRAISDFLTISRAEQAYALNEESLFFTMARIYGSSVKEIIKKGEINT